MVTVPEPWQNNQEMSRDRRDLYRYYATMMEPWDGPAALIFSDGDIVGASLDRNGLRPSRYLLTDDDYLILASEVGVLDIDPAKVLRKERLKPARSWWWIPSRARCTRTRSSRKPTRAAGPTASGCTSTYWK